jgi:signal transduction histidine kinase
MFKFGLKFLLSVFLIFFLSPKETYAEDKVKTVVMFFPLNASMPSFQNILDGFKSSFHGKYNEPYNLVIEYLDMNRSLDQAYIKHLVELYNEKTAKTQIDLIILVPPFTYTLLKKFGLEALKNTPTISMDFDFPLNYDPTEKAAWLLLNNNAINIDVVFDMKKTLMSAFDLFPEYKDVYVITGCSQIDEFFELKTKQSIKDFNSSYNFSLISCITLDSTIQIVKNIPEKSIVVVPMYLSDSKNIHFSTPEVINMLVNNCKAPIFPATDSFLKRKGGIGGNIFSFYYVGKEMGNAASEFINGKNIKEISLDQNNFYQYMYDWQQLKKWGLLDSDAIPAHSIFYNKESDFISEYKWYIALIVLFLTFETILLVYLYKLNRNQKVMAIEKEETENLYRELVREDRVLRMSEITASLSHELNQPLNAILLNAQAGMHFLESGKLNDKLIKTIFERIIRDDNRAGGLISSVKSLMKPEPKEAGIVDCNAVILETVNIYHAEATKQHIQIRLNTQEKQVFVSGNKLQLQQVMLNFLSNAVIAMKDTAPEKKLLEISQSVNNDWVTVKVRDYGSGIDDTIKDILFEPFITTHKNGFGIGLALSRSIIARHNGEIWAENREDGGAEFAFRLKRFKDE